MEEKKDLVPAMAISASSNPIKTMHAGEEADFAHHSINSRISKRKAYLPFMMFQIRL